MTPCTQVHRVDADGSGAVEFDEFAVLLRAISPLALRQTEVEAVSFESHPLVQQVQALQSSQRLQLMYAHPEQAERQATRSALLSAALKRLEQGLRQACGDGLTTCSSSRDIYTGRPDF